MFFGEGHDLYIFLLFFLTFIFFGGGGELGRGHGHPLSPMDPSLHGTLGIYSFLEINGS
jgi:hypothetical protein